MKVFFKFILIILFFSFELYIFAQDEEKTELISDLKKNDVSIVTDLDNDINSTENFKAYEVPNFTWKLALLTKDGEFSKVHSINEKINLKSREDFQLYIESSSVAFCYIIDETPEGIMFEMFRTALKPNRPIYLPDASEWYELPPPNGLEKIHIVISSRSFKPLELFAQDIDNLNRNNNSYEASRTLRTSLERFRTISNRNNKTKVTIGTINSSKKIDYPVKSEEVVEFLGNGVYVQTIEILNGVTQ